MKSGQLHSFRTKIKQTSTFQSCCSVAQKITMARNNVYYIYRGLEEAKEKGLKNWKQNTSFNNRNIEIITELIKS